MVKIYTKTGDKGITSVSNRRIKKSEDFFYLLGSLDSLNANMGFLISNYLDNIDHKELLNTKDNLISIQKLLIKISSLISGYYVEIKLEDEINFLEKEIDRLDSLNQKLTKFIIAGGTKPSAFLHILRTKSREVERDMVSCYDWILENHADLEALVSKEINLQKELADVLSYANRLSDYFFVLARAFNDFGKKDIVV